MSTQNKSFFFTVVPNTDRFLSGDEPTEAIMRDLCDSVPFKLESSDSATESQQGLVESATQIEFDSGIDSNGIGYSLYVRPSFIKTALTLITTTIQTQIDAIVNDITNINNSITSINNSITTINSEISTINTEISTITTTIESSMPVGSIIMFPVDAAPSADWLQLNGQTVLTGDYPLLFTLIGYTFGGGGGSFDLPDTRQKMLAGYDQLGAPDYNQIGAGAGVNSQTLTSTQCAVPLHTHDLGASGNGTGSTGFTPHQHNFKYRIIGDGNAGVNTNVLIDELEPGTCEAHDCAGGGSHNHSISSISLSGTTESYDKPVADDPFDNRAEFVVFPQYIKAK